jgi:hypothetical protein
MPTYMFKNTATGEVFEKVMKISELDAYKAVNPTHERYFDAAPAFTGDHIILKKDTGFKEVLQKINERAFGGMKESGSSQL